MEKTTNKPLIFSKQCPHCPKVISSLIESQFNYNYDQHLKSHERKKDSQATNEVKK